MIPTGMTTAVDAHAALLLWLTAFVSNFTQQIKTISVKNNIIPSPVENPHATWINTFIFSCGDSFTAFTLCTLLTASILGKIHVLIINANRWTDTSNVVHTQNTIRSAGDTSDSIWISTSATWKDKNNIRDYIVPFFLFFNNDFEFRGYLNPASFTWL